MSAQVVVYLHYAIGADNLTSSSRYQYSDVEIENIL